MLNFTAGPVMSDGDILSIGSEQVPYFRTPEFSNLMFENERLIKKLVKQVKILVLFLLQGLVLQVWKQLL